MQCVEQGGADKPMCSRFAARLREKPGHAHFMGVCGVGMAGLARLLRDEGWRVDGCDARPDPNRRAWLLAHGIPVRAGHDASHAAGADVLVHTAAAPDSAPEVKAARAAGVIVVRRGEAMAAWSSMRRTVAVCGSHGKTTTAAVLTRLLHAVGHSAGWCIGGECEGLDGVAGGSLSDLLVVEADESDGTLASYRPWVTVLTNIDDDHMEHFGSAAVLDECFRAVVSSTIAWLVYCADDARAAKLAGDASAVIGYGLNPTCALHARDVRFSRQGCSFAVVWRGRQRGRARLPVIGMHNVYNALGALGAALVLGVPVREAVSCLGRSFRLPRRRFDLRAASRGVRVVSDYAHHPTAIAALLPMALACARRVWVVFQPHRFSRTRALAEAFPRAFGGAHAVVLTPVYAASEAPIEGGSSADLYARFREAGLASGSVELAASPEEAWEGVRRRLRRGDMLLVVGAGDVERVGEWAAEAVKAGRVGVRSPLGTTGPPAREWVRGLRAEGYRGKLACGVPLGPLTGYGVGGPADVLAQPRSSEDLCLLLRCSARSGVRVRCLGAGMNLLVPDAGVGGVVVRLAGPRWSRCQCAGERVWVGAGLNGAGLLGRLERHGLAGLEFMQGIPGTVGGWVAMNAGAQGRAFGETVEEIHCLTLDGEPVIVPTRGCGWGYRKCAAVKDSVVIGARLRLERATPERVHAERVRVRAGRREFGVGGCAGSVFRNPPGDAAGRLLDARGCRGMQIGGAKVSERHANVVLTEPGATASDVRALMDLMQARVHDAFGLSLDPEVCVW